MMKLAAKTTLLCGSRAAAALGMLLLAAPAAALEVDQAVLDAESARVEVVARASATAVAIFSPGGQGGGSGVVISPDGYALTNFHVTSGAGIAMKCGMADGELYDAVLVGLDPTGDVALIKLLGRDDFPCAELADSDAVRVGDWCFAVGNPFLLANDFTPSVSYGIVSGVHRYQYPAGTLLEYADCIQADAAINPGNSGGPLFDAAGRVIGVNGRGSFEKRGRVNVGVGYAISSNQLKNFLGCLHSGRVVDHATLGALVADDAAGRVRVTQIVDESDAYRRGLRYRDEIVEFAGRPIRTANGFKNVLGIFPKGWRVPVTVRRDTEVRELAVRLAGLHRTGELDELLRGPMPEQPMPQPQPGDEPPGDGEPENPPSGDGGPGDRPMPLPGRPRPAAPEIPESVRPFYEARTGYANYYFNRLHQERIWKGLQSHGDFAGDLEWVLSTELVGLGPVRLTIGDDRAVASYPAGDATLLAGDDLSQNLDPPGTGGLLAALFLWRRLLVGGIEPFGQVYYFGTLPLAGQEQPVDVLVGVHGGVECRFYVDPAGGRLLALEMFSADDADPCEIAFGDYVEAEGRFTPGSISVRYGDAEYGTFKVIEFAVADGGEPAS